MILESHVAQQGVVLLDTRRKFNELGLIFVHLVAGNEALVELNDLTEGEMLSRRAIESPSGLDQLAVHQVNQPLYSLHNQQSQALLTMRVS